MKPRLILLFLSCGLALDAAGGEPPIDFPPPEGAVLYGANDRTPASIFEVDPTTGAVSNVVTASVSGSEMDVEIFSLATQPGTNTIFCVFQEDYPSSTLPSTPIGFPVALGTIDPATGLITPIADFSIAGEDTTITGGIPGITFCCDGTLWAVTGGVRGPNAFPGYESTWPPDHPLRGSGHIFSVNPATAVMTFLTSGEPGFAQSLECNSADGMLYHFFSTKGPFVERIDPGTGESTPVSLSGTVYFGIQGAVDAGGGRILGHQSDDMDTFFLITSAGVVSLVGPSPTSPYDNVRALAYDKAIGCALFQPDLLIGRTARNLKVNDFYTRNANRQTIRLRTRGQPRSVANFLLEIQNDGTAPDRIGLRTSLRNPNPSGAGPLGTSFFLRRSPQFKITARGRNFTRILRNQGLLLQPGERQRFKAEFKTRRRIDPRNKRRILTLTVISKSDGSKIDTGELNLRL